MNWNVKLIKFWIENYYALKGHEIKFWQEQDNYSGEVAVHSKGARFRAPFIATADKNIEFDLAVKSLGVLGEQVFRLCWLDGYKTNEVIKMIDGYRVRQIFDRKWGVYRELVDYSNKSIQCYSEANLN